MRRSQGLIASPSPASLRVSKFSNVVVSQMPGRNKNLTVRLTPLEAKALRWAAGQVFEACSYEEGLRDYFHNKLQDFKAGRRAYSKLLRAIDEAAQEQDRMKHQDDSRNQRSRKVPAAASIAGPCARR